MKKYFCTILIFLICPTLYVTTGWAQQRAKIERFNYKGVKLEQGNLERQFTEVCEYYLRLPNDDLLKPYRQRAGKDAPGKDMGGCYISHNPFGQYLSGFARMYAATGDSVYKKKATTLMTGWAECIEPDGFFFAEKNPQIIPYYYEKMLGGLLDIYEYCGNNRAIEYLDQITDWAEKNMSRARLYANPLTNDGGEWYTLSENLYRAYLLTKNKRYEELAKVYEYRDFWNFFYQGKDTDFLAKPHPGWYHAYSHVNSFNGLGAGYLVEGDPSNIKALINAYDYLQEYQCLATGGFGPKECLIPKEKLIESLNRDTTHFETQCGSWAGFKMTKYLIQLTGNARFGDWTERLLINGIGASIPMSADGKVFYYSSYNTGGARKCNINAQWPCCSGTRAEAVSDYHDIIYYKDACSLYITQFTPSTVETNIDRSGIKVTQKTKFPESDVDLITVKTESSKKFAIKIRVPGWLSAPMKAWINGKETEVNIDSCRWAIFNRKWANGDVLKIKLPMNMWVSKINKNKDFPAAIMYGPVTMAIREMGSNPASKIDLKNLNEIFIPSEGDPLTWKLKTDPSVVLRPFYAFKENERYFLYLDPSISFPRKKTDKK